MTKVYGKCSEGWAQPTKFGKDGACIENYECTGNCMFMRDEGECPYLEKEKEILKV